MLLEKYIPAYKVTVIIILVNIIMSTLSVLFWVPYFIYIIMCTICSVIGIILVSAVIPNTELIAGDEKAKFIKNTFMYSFILGCMNLGVAFGTSFVIVSIVGGLLFKISSIYISSAIISTIGFIIYIVVQWRFLTYSGYQATIRKEYNGPLFGIIGALAMSFQIPFIMGDWVIKTSLEGTFPTYNIHTFLSILPIWRSPIPAAAGVLLMVCLNIFIIYTFYKKGREAFFDERPNNKGYDEEQQSEIYKNEKVREK